MQFLFFFTWILFWLTWILREAHVKYSTGSPGIDGKMPPRSCCLQPSGLWWTDPAAYGVLILRSSLCCCLVRTSPRDPVECLERGPVQPGDITYPTYSGVWFGPDHCRSFRIFSSLLFASRSFAFFPSLLPPIYYYIYV